MLRFLLGLIYRGQAKAQVPSWPGGSVCSWYYGTTQ